jgi:predicted nucleic acid-binding Zn ribbon protein
MAKTKMTRIGDVLPSLLRRFGLEQRFKEQAVLTLWPDVVGPEIAARTRASRIDKGVLYIRVDHGAWIQELHFIEKDLLRKLRAAAPGVELQRIRFSAREH